MIKTIILACLGLGLIQFIPYGKDHTNPKVLNVPKWDSVQTKELFTKACAACHSNNSVYPKYASYAPVSWLVQSDIDEGRDHFNISTIGYGGRQKTNEIGEVINSGEMPPMIYTVMHKEAILSKSEKQALIKGLQKTLK